jgi:hypothetical protein
MFQWRQEDTFGNVTRFVPEVSRHRIVMSGNVAGREVTEEVAGASLGTSPSAFEERHRLFRILSTTVSTQMPPIFRHKQF